jgi:hypothetical protein
LVDGSLVSGVARSASISSIKGLSTGGVIIAFFYNLRKASNTLSADSGIASRAGSGTA